MSEDFHQNHELIMPFVVCASNGGPYDDDSFVAGWYCGAVNRELEQAAKAVGPPGKVLLGTLHLPTLTMPQVDLIAMRHGFAIRDQVDIDGMWTMCSVVRVKVEL